MLVVNWKLIGSEVINVAALETILEVKMTAWKE